MCLYVGDIGDNKYQRDHISIYRIAEPLVLEFNTSTTTGNWQVGHYRYPNDQKFNAESMMIDESTGEIVIVTKSKIPPYAFVFKAALNVKQDLTLLEDTGIRLNLPDATDATSSADGQVVIVRLYMGAFLWPKRSRHSTRSIVDILREEECLVSVGMQRQGESVALDPSGSSYFTHSEFVNQTIWQFNIYQ